MNFSLRATEVYARPDAHSCPGRHTFSPAHPPRSTAGRRRQDLPKCQFCHSAVLPKVKNAYFCATTRRQGHGRLPGAAAGKFFADVS